MHVFPKSILFIATILFDIYEILITGFNDSEKEEYWQCVINALDRHLYWRMMNNNLANKFTQTAFKTGWWCRGLWRSCVFTVTVREDINFVKNDRLWSILRRFSLKITQILRKALKLKCYCIIHQFLLRDLKPL